jgi:hypothetical protein
MFTHCYDRWSTPELTEMLLIAGCGNYVALAQWLRQQGAEWPAALSWQGGEEWWGE